MAANADMARILKTIKNNINDMADPKVMKKLGEFAVGMIKTRVRLGFGVVGAGDTIVRKKFVALADSTIRSRTRTTLHNTTSAKRSNLTRKGTMVESIKVSLISQGVITIRPTGSNIKISNNELASIHENGLGRVPRRRFLALTAKEEKKLNRFYRQTFGDLVKKGLT